MKRFVLAKLLPVVLAVSSCTLSPEKSPPSRFHDLGPLPSRADGSPAAWSAVDVDAPEWLRGDRIRYRFVYSDPTRVGFYTLDRWIAPPSELLAQRFALLGDGGPFRIRIELEEFEQIFERPGSARAVIRFRALVYELGSNKRLAERMFQLSRISPSADAAGAVASFAGLTDESVSTVRAWVESMGVVHKPVTGPR
ncbi:hypothetical protein [Methylocaldum sp.]|uniref:ABC-type transport auxiliary lipoprotein family protein n=1 Tax=Methylocaldum sp. TaxID=1969727 RepID=UPI002D3E3E12|nr:hypothetical protein [Methylocaldum sp.]HYE36336.1 hypothetical protein [Methylocaldum sp.]